MSTLLLSTSDKKRVCTQMMAALPLCAEASHLNQTLSSTNMRTVLMAMFRRPRVGSLSAMTMVSVHKVAKKKTPLLHFGRDLQERQVQTTRVISHSSVAAQ